MLTEETGPGRLMRIWAGELPPLRYEVADELKGVVEATPRGKTSMAAAVEMRQLWNGQSYALIGGTFTPADSTTLIIEVAVSRYSNEIRWPLRFLSLSWTPTTRPGLLPDFGRYVLDLLQGSDNIRDSLKASDVVQSLGAGTLRFDCAAWSDWSTQAVFALAARFVVTHLVGGSAPITPESSSPA